MSLIPEAENDMDYSLCIAYEKYGLEPDWNQARFEFSSLIYFNLISSDFVLFDLSKDTPTTTTEWFTSGLGERGLFNFFETTETTTTTVGPVNDLFEKGHPRYFSA